jgi:hypothetical protein
MITGRILLAADSPVPLDQPEKKGLVAIKKN